jgi:hypothetical protein
MGHTQARRAQAVAEEFETMRAIAKKEREVAKKLEAVRIETEARIAREAAIRDAERKRKVEEKLKKSQAILKEIERKGEESRLKAIEKEKRIQAILEVRSRVASRRLHAVDATRVHQTMPGVLSLSNLRPFGPRRGRAACPREERSRRWREVARTDAVAATASMRCRVALTPSTRPSERRRAAIVSVRHRSRRPRRRRRLELQERRPRSASPLR